MSAKKPKNGAKAAGVSATSEQPETSPTPLPDYRILRKLPTMDEVFGQERTKGMAVFNRGRPKDRDKWYDFGNEVPLDPAISAITEQYWPEIFDSTRGGCATVEPEDGVKLEKLCDMFGVPLKLKTSTSDEIGYAYEVFVLSFGKMVRHELERPTYLRRIHSSWPPGWIEFIEAVANGQREEARQRAREMRVLYSDCQYPSYPSASYYKQPEGMDATLDAMWAIEDAKA